MHGLQEQAQATFPGRLHYERISVRQIFVTLGQIFVAISK